MAKEINLDLAVTVGTQAAFPDAAARERLNYSRNRVRDALEAALPYIRREIAAQIRAEANQPEYVRPVDPMEKRRITDFEWAALVAEGSIRREES